MSATLQQIESNRLPLFGSSTDGGSSSSPEAARLEASAVCVHRRSQTMICTFVNPEIAGSSSAPKYMLRTYSRNSWGKWLPGKSTWQLPAQFVSPPVACRTIESMDIFVLLCTVRGTGQVLLVYINLDGLEINRYDISHVAKAASCAPRPLATTPPSVLH
mgnify:CR=1 FL=1